jgi:hypothetical protein
MNTNTQTSARQGRPAWVIAICLYYVFIALWGLGNWLQISFGISSLPEEHQAMLRNQSPAAVAFALLLWFLNLAAALWLWLLRKRALELFVSAFVLSLAHTTWQVVMGGPLGKLFEQGTLQAVIGFVSLTMGFGISLAICLYVWKLRRTGILR